MKKSRTGLIITISIIAGIIIILGTLAILYFVTDLFKGDQELFFKYLAKNVNVIEDYFEDPNKLTKDAIRSDKHTTKTDIGFDLVSSDQTIANQTIPPRNFTIQYVGQADPQNNMDSSEATIKFLTKDLFNVKYAHNQDLYALTSAEIINGGVYLAVDNNNLKELAKKVDIADLSNIPNRIEKIDVNALLNVSEEDKKYLQNTYMQIINSEISKDNYTRKKDVTIQIDTKEIQTNCYTLKLTSTEYKKVLVAVLNNLKQDDKTLNLLLGKITMVDSQTDITLQTLKTNIDSRINQITNDQTIGGVSISVYEKDGQLVRTQIEKQNEEKYTFSFEKTNNSIRTIIDYEYNYAQQNNTSNIIEDTTNYDDDYIQIEGDNQVQNNQNTQQENTSSNNVIIKGIEIAKQIEGTQSNTIIVATFETQADKTIKVSVQSKTSPDTQTQGVINNNTIININDSDITYFTIKANTIMSVATSVTVDELNTNNSFITNTFNKEYIDSLTQQIKRQLQRKYEEKMNIAKTVQEEENASQGLNSVDPNAPEANNITANTLDTTL